MIGELSVSGLIGPDEIGDVLDYINNIVVSDTSIT